MGESGAFNQADPSRRIDAANDRIDTANGRIDALAAEMHQRFDRVHHGRAENRERMAKLEGALDGFPAGRRGRNAA